MFYFRFLLLSALIVGCSCEPTKDFIQGMNMILLGNKNVVVDRFTCEKFDPIIESAVDKLIFCSLRECSPSMFLGNVNYLRWAVKEVYESISQPIVLDYLRKTDGMETHVWESQWRRIRFSQSHPRNYTSTGIQFGDIIFNLYYQF
jgi:hypothetical protein